jgi:hypothetical protein
MSPIAPFGALWAERGHKINELLSGERVNICLIIFQYKEK